MECRGQITKNSPITWKQTSDGVSLSGLIKGVEGGGGGGGSIKGSQVVAEIGIILSAIVYDQLRFFVITKPQWFVIVQS